MTGADADVKPFVFVVMSFRESTRDVYDLAIRPACIEAGAECARVDEQIFDENVMQQTYGELRRAAVVIAEMSERSPNVFYETGYAHGIGKRVLPITTNADDIPFDLKHYTHIIYSANGLAVLQQEVVRRLVYFFDNPRRDGYFVGHDPYLARMAIHITNYLVANRFRAMSFRRIQERINNDYSDDDILELIDQNPETFRRVRLRSGEGIGLLRRR